MERSKPVLDLLKTLHWSSPNSGKIQVLYHGSQGPPWNPRLVSCHSALLFTSLNSASPLSIALGVYSVPSTWVTLLTLHLGNLKGFLSLPETSVPLETLTDRIRCPSSGPPNHLSSVPQDLACSGVTYICFGQGMKYHILLPHLWTAGRYLRK